VATTTTTTTTTTTAATTTTTTAAAESAATTTAPAGQVAPHCHLFYSDSGGYCACVPMSVRISLFHLVILQL
jgi:hypothetical protein